MKFEENSQETFLPKILGKETVLAMNEWNFLEGEKLKEFLCVVTSYRKSFEGGTLPGRKLSFYKKIDDKLIKKYKYETGDSFLTMYPLSEINGNLLTIWGGGSAYHFNVFSLKDNEIRIVLEAGSKALPEIADIDNDGEYEILIWAGNFEVLKTKENTELSFFEKKRIFKWQTADIYKLIKTVPWENRFTALKKIN